MISKLELKNVINKYHLNGLVEAVKWEIKDNILSIKFTSPTKEMIGEIQYNKFNIQDSTIGISNTKQLLKLIEITNNDLLLSYIKNQKIFTKLIISDNQYTINYSLADLMVISKSGTYTDPEKYNVTLILNQENISALIKAKSALVESNTVILKLFSDIEDTKLEMVFGGDIEYANKVSYYLPIFSSYNIDSDFKLGFDSGLFYEILYANKDMDGKISINLEGVMKLEFESENIKSVYYIVKKEIN